MGVPSVSGVSRGEGLQGQGPWGPNGSAVPVGGLGSGLNLGPRDGGVLGGGSGLGGASKRRNP